MSALFRSAAALIRSIGQQQLALRPCIPSDALALTSHPALRQPNFIQSRNAVSFFGRYTAEQLWKSATSVSNQGKKRGRARGRKMIKNLNRGQVIGVGKVNMVWPGLNAPVIRGKEQVKREQLPADPTREEKIFKIRDSIEKLRSQRISPLERGWSGTKMPGRSIGSPDPIGDDSFEQFDTRVLEMKQVANMTGTLGRKRRFSILVVTGNKNGLMGTALAKAIDAKAALRKAKNLSIKKLRFIERFENRTVFHDFYHQIDSTAVFVKRKPAGYGFVGHRALKTICDVVGIKDVYAKVEGRSNLQKIIKCFIAGLEKQETHAALAERKRLNVVELDPVNRNFPKLLAAPEKSEPRKDRTEIGQYENVEFSNLYMDGKVRLVKPKQDPFYTKLPSWQKKLQEMEMKRNWDNIRYYHWLQKDLKPEKANFYGKMLDPDVGHKPGTYSTEPRVKPKKR